MALALSLARRGLGRVWPNPAVGCVAVDNDGHVVGRGWTQDGGRPHAETVALAQAGARARGATAYVSLEPCAHHGQTPPCAQALIDAGVVRVVSAVEDPDARVAGKGHAMLAAAGVSVRIGVMGSHARALNEGFFSRVVRGRPFVTLKLATTLDGKIALKNGESRWITGAEARAHTHLERSRHDAVAVGIGTVLADDPELTCRLPGVKAVGPVRIVLDTKARLPVTSQLATTARAVPVWVVSSQPCASLQAAGVKVLQVSATAEGVDLAASLKALAGEGLTRVLVEGGATIASALLKAGLVDRLLWYRAPSVMGEGIAAVTLAGLGSLKDMPRFVREETIRLGEDVLETYRPAT
jgi:diaminohydroxyphosphoribosylaminopyrimidine deaminase / 5-amino-6-(5-phosphoribosylamino)uracil reductase